MVVKLIRVLCVDVQEDLCHPNLLIAIDYPATSLSLRAGLLYSLKQCLRLRVKGLCWLGIPCSLLVFMSIATSKRGIQGYDMFGNVALECVRRSNTQLSRSALLALVCFARRVWWCAEQPASSRLPLVEYFARILQSPALETYMTRLLGPHHSWKFLFWGKNVCIDLLLAPLHMKLALSWMGVFKHFSPKPSILFGSWLGP